MYIGIDSNSLEVDGRSFCKRNLGTCKTVVPLVPLRKELLHQNNKQEAQCVFAFLLEVLIFETFVLTFYSVVCLDKNLK